MTISTTTLKNAAFAIEHDLWTDSDGANYLVKDGAILRRWKPEHSSGDAFDLAIALYITIEPEDGKWNAWRRMDTGVEFFSRRNTPHEAIVLCAQMIGAELCQS